MEYLYAEALVEWVKALPKGTHPDPLTQEAVDSPRSSDALLWLFRCFSARSLSDQVLKHLLRLTLWEIERSRGDEDARADQTEPVSLDSWRESLLLISETMEAVAYRKFFEPGKDRSPSLYHYLSWENSTLGDIDSDVAAGFLNATGILGHALLPEAGRPHISALGDSDVLQRASRHHRRIFLRSWDLSSAGLNLFRIQNADLRDGDLTSAHLDQAWIEGDCRDADFSGAHLERAVLLGVFSGVDFTGAEAQHTRLHECLLMDADFSEANLEGTDISAASIQGADLRTAKNLTQKQLDGAHGDDTTKLPERLHRPPAWPYERPAPGDWETDTYETD
jgi:hypothetical protein